MTYNNNPLEMGLDRLIDWGLPDSAAISLPALRRIKAAGVHRRIVGVELDGEPFPALNFNKWPAYVAGGTGEPIGKVTSAIYSPRLAKNIGYCWVPAALAAEGTKLRVVTEWGIALRPSCQCPSSTRASAFRSRNRHGRRRQPLSDSMSSSVRSISAAGGADACGPR
jgi:aminomethyltransferase